MYFAKMFPVMPSLLPTYFVMYSTDLAYSIGEASGYLIFGIVTVVMIAVCSLIGRRSRRLLLAICIAMFVFQVFNALGSYAMFRG